MKVSVFIATSLDGFIARPNGELDWLPPVDHDEDYGYAAFMESVDVLVMGRRTYEKVLTFPDWPYGGKQVIVLSSNPASVPVRAEHPVEVLSASPSEVVRLLETRGAKHAYVDGGRTIRGFLAEGLVNALTITRVPVLIGTGIPLFGDLVHDIRLRHISTRSYGSGLVQSTYEVTRK